MSCYYTETQGKDLRLEIYLHKWRAGKDQDRDGPFKSLLQTGYVLGWLRDEVDSLLALGQHQRIEPTSPR